MTVTGVIQAGGKSTRMGGTPKALLTVGGRRIVERVLAALTPAVDDVLMVTNTPELYAFLGLRMVADDLPDHGSLGGIYTGTARGDGCRPRSPSPATCVSRPRRGPPRGGARARATW